jgi:DNA-binding transcriptional LysR family regulator
VSDLVQGLEKHLGVRLLQRTTRRVTTTADGAAFYERRVHILADLDEAEMSVMQARVAPKGRLRVDIPKPFHRAYVVSVRRQGVA